MRALLSHAAGEELPDLVRELRPIYGPFEGGMDRFVELAKNDFIGRDAASARRRGGGSCAASPSSSTPTTPTCMGDEPIWHDGKVVGWVTSGGYAHYVDKSLALGYVPKELAGDRQWRLRDRDHRRAAQGDVITEPLFDPKGERMRG